MSGYQLVYHMSRLPIPGSDSNQWGAILNDYLSQAHSSSGQLKDDSVGSSAIQDGAVTSGKIAPGSVTNSEVSDTAAIAKSKLAALNVGDSDVDEISQTKITGLVDNLLAKADKTTTVSGATSLAGGGSLASNRTLTLVNDSASPGNSKYYGTDGSGNKGYHNVPVSSGEANTASNVGVGGVGLYKQKTGVDLEFKNINAGSNKVTVTNDASNNEVDIDVAPANFTGIPQSGITDLATDLGNKANTSTAISGTNSISGGGDLSTSRTLALVNDTASPGNSYYYGTNGSGTKGYYTLPTTSSSKVLPYSNTGTLSVLTGTHRLYNDSGSTWTINSVRASVGTAPTGASVIVDINVDGITIFTTQSNRPTIAASGFTSGKVTNMDVTTIANGSYITVDIDQIGSVIAGSDLCAQLEVA
jgi:hypothetical protein